MICFCIWVCHFGFVLSCLVIFCHFFVFFCHLFVILLSFWEREMGKKNVKKWLPWQTFCYLVAAPNTRNKCRNSWKASRRWRRIGQGSLPWGIRFWACLDEQLSPGSGCRAGSKTGPGWNGRGGGSGPRSGPTSKNATLPARESFVWHFLHFLCISSAFFCMFFAFPRLGVIFLAFFCISQTGRHFLFFFAFPKPGLILCIFFAFPRPGLPLSPLAWSLWENDKKMNNARK